MRWGEKTPQLNPNYSEWEGWFLGVEWRGKREGFGGVRAAVGELRVLQALQAPAPGAEPGKLSSEC